MHYFPVIAICKETQFSFNSYVAIVAISIFLTNQVIVIDYFIMFGMIKQSSFQLMDAVSKRWSSIVGRRMTKDNSFSIYTVVQ